jgi:hypothetical protein
MAKRRDQKKKAAHRTLMAQHAAAKQKKMLETIQKIQEVLEANPHLADQLQNSGTLPGSPQGSGLSLTGY